MKGDFTRLTFDPLKHYSRLYMQQGRVQLDADWNEQSAIWQHQLRTLIVDLIGTDAGPVGAFQITQDEEDDLWIAPGRYYVDGILCENEPEYDQSGAPLALAYIDQPGYPFPDSVPELEGDEDYLIYLDVWERHVTHVQDPAIREVALGGPDTATRAQVVWQVKALPFEWDTLDEIDLDGLQDYSVKQRSVLLHVALVAARRALQADRDNADLIDRIQKIRTKLASLSRGSLRARAKQDQTSDDPCITPPEARYRGAENQLYRVEVHRGGEAGTATFKWSQDNGSVVFPILSLRGSEVELAHLGRDATKSLRVNDWVEIVDDESALRGGSTWPLLKVAAVDPVEFKVMLDVPEGVALPTYDKPEPDGEPGPLPLLRRWDHKAGEPASGVPQLAKDGALLIEEGIWLKLQDGLQVKFQKRKGETEQHTYRAGDYWLIPARTATGDVEWPGPKANPRSVPPHGVEHHYAPLAIMDNTNETVDDCRMEIAPPVVAASP